MLYLKKTFENMGAKSLLASLVLLKPCLFFAKMRENVSCVCFLGPLIRAIRFYVLPNDDRWYISKSNAFFRKRKEIKKSESLVIFCLLANFPAAIG